MGKKIVRVGDYHQCPLWDGKTPHVGGPVLDGIPNVLINGKPVAVVGSRAQCNGGVDTIVSGDPRLLINGLPVAVEGSPTAHGGLVVGASGNVGTGGSLRLPNQEALRAEWENALAVLGDHHPAADAIRQCLSYLGPKPESLTDYPPVAMMEPGKILPDPYPPEGQAHLKPVNPANSPRLSGMAAKGETAPTEDREGDNKTGDGEPKRVVINAGFFFDGTANNRFNTEDAAPNRPDFLSVRRQFGNDARAAWESEDIRHWREGIGKRGRSYGNDYTNIAKLQRLYFDAIQNKDREKLIGLSIYIEGIGTIPHDKDRQLGLATGLGETGVIAKAMRAREVFVERLEAIETELTGDYELIVDVFGFSRGAAAARHFVNMLADDKQRLQAGQTTMDHYPSDSFLRPVLEARLPVPESITIRFLGLYDTVPAVANFPDGDLSPHDDDNHPVRLQVRPEHVGYAVQFCAADEFRYNFSLTSLRDANGNLAPNCREYVLPGAHSDIGGAYHHHDIDAVWLMPDVTVPDIRGPQDQAPYDRTPEYLERKALMERLVREGWCDDRDIVLEVRPLPGAPENGVHEATTVEPDGTVRKRTLIGTRRQYRLKQRMYRFVHGDYARISLYLMHEAAQIQGVPFMDLEKPSLHTDVNNPDAVPYQDSRKLNGTRLSGVLTVFWKQLRMQMRVGNPCTFDDNQLLSLRRHWLHYSANWEPVYSIIHPNAPVVSTKKRAVYPNA